MKITSLFILLFALPVVIFSQVSPDKSLFEFDNNSTIHWSSPENRNGIKGAGGKENNEAKGHPYDTIAAGKTYTLLDVQAKGIIKRIGLLTLSAPKLKMFVYS